MSTYTHILVGLDLTPESKTVLNKVEQLARQFSAQVSLVHVIEPLTFAYAGDLPIDLMDTQQVLQEHAQTKLNELVQQSPMEIASSTVVVGPTAHEIRQIANDVNADLLVVGSHGRHGIALLLGSTASDLLHGAEIDVLAVRI